MNASAMTAPVIPPHPSSPNSGWLTAYPLRTYLELGAYRSAAGSARGHARNVLAEWGLGHLEDAVTLALSELVTNAVNATEKVAWEAGRPPVLLWLLGRPGTSDSTLSGANPGGPSTNGLSPSGPGISGSGTRGSGMNGPGVGGSGTRDTSASGPGADGAGGGGEVMLLVWDAIAEVPAGPGLADELAESGRGLWMACKYSTRLDFYRPRWAHGGKVARALITRPAPLEDLVAACRPAEILPVEILPAEILPGDS